MTNTWKTMALVVPLALVAACTDAAKAPAEAAMAAAGTAVESLKGEAARFAPDAVKSVEASYASAKDLVAKQDYKGALAAAAEIPAKAKEALARAAAAKDAFVKTWNEAGGSISKTIDAARSRLDVLAKSKKLPAGMDKAALASAQSGLASLETGWASATEQFKSGDMSGAIARANALKAQGMDLLKAIGLQ
jgi:hypothetical protein